MTTIALAQQRSRWAFAALGIGISLFFLWISFRNLNPERVLANFGQANFGLLAAAALIYFVGLALISVRWHYVLRSIQNIPATGLMPLVAICYMGNNVYPFRTGEILRIYLLQRDHGVAIAKTTATVFVERVFDGLIMLAFIFIGLLSGDVQSPEIRRLASIAAPLFLVAFAVFLALARMPALMRKMAVFFAGFLPGRLGKIALHLSEEVIEGMESLRTPADFLGAIVYSFGSWMIEAAVYWIVAMAFSLPLSYPVMLLTVGVVNLAGLIPASPGQIGVYEYFVSLVLIGAGIPRDLALAYAFVIHMVIWLPVTLVGFVLLMRQGLGLGIVKQARRIERETVS